MAKGILKRPQAIKNTVNYCSTDSCCNDFPGQISQKLLFGFFLLSDEHDYQKRT